jgi:hypothetical protein
MAYTTPTTHVAGETLPAADWNVVVNDVIATAPFFSAWTDYTPTWTQGVTVANTKTYARYMSVGKMCWVSLRLAATGAGTGGAQISISLPVTAIRGVTENYNICGAAMYYDVSVPTNYVCAIQLDANAVRFATDTSAGNYFGINPAVTTASGDFVSFNICYEIA